MYGYYIPWFYTTFRWEGNIKTNFKEMGYEDMDRICLAEDGD